MTTTYRTAGAWGAGSGADLTPAQVDTNFYDKETRLNALEALSLAVGIDHITVSGDQMTIIMSDASTQGPFTLPTAEWNPRGIWQPASLYNALDVVTYGGTAYLVLATHTSASTFDPNAGGTTPYYSALWSYEPAPGIERTATTFSPALEDANTYNRMTNVSGCVVTIDSALGFPAWTEMHFRDETGLASSGVSIQCPTPGAINGVTGFDNASLCNGATITVKQVSDTGSWDIMGLLLAVTV